MTTSESCTGIHPKEEELCSTSVTGVQLQKSRRLAMQIEQRIACVVCKGVLPYACMSRFASRSREVLGCESGWLPHPSVVADAAPGEVVGVLRLQLGRGLAEVAPGGHHDQMRRGQCS